MLVKEEVFWRQKSRETWLDAGDSNSNFFHASTENRRGVNRILRAIKEDGSIVVKLEEVAKESANYFREIFNNWEGLNLANQAEMLSCILNKIIESQNINLTAKFFETKIHSNLSQLHPDKAPGPDGFPASFYKKMLAYNRQRDD